MYVAAVKGSAQRRAVWEKVVVWVEWLRFEGDGGVGGGYGQSKCGTGDFAGAVPCQG